MITIVKWKMFFEEWKQVLEEKYQNKNVKYDYEYDGGNIQVEDEVSFFFCNNDSNFLFITIEQCNEEQFQYFGEELMKLIQKHEMDVFVRILYGTKSWFDRNVYETEEMLEEYIPSGERTKSITQTMKEIEYSIDRDREFCLLDSHNTLFHSSITLEFDLERKSILLMIDGGGDTKKCYTECFSAEEVNAFAATYKKEKEQVKKIEQKATKLLEKTYPGENIHIYFEFSRTLDTNFYDLEFYVDETAKRMYMSEIEEEKVLSLISQAQKVAMETKHIKKELKKYLYQKDSYSYQYDEDIYLFKAENKVRMYIGFKSDPGNYCVKVNYGEMKGNSIQYKTKHFIGTKDEVLVQTKKLFDTLYNQKRMTHLFSPTNSHLEKMIVQLIGNEKQTVIEEDLPKRRGVIEKELQQYYKESTEKNGIPKVPWERYKEEIHLETVKFSKTDHGTIRVSNI